MNKKGFVFIETIIVITIITASLLTIYSSYRNSIIREKTRVHYDDPAFIYKSYIVTKYLINNSNINELIANYYNADNYSLMLPIGTETESLFSDNQNSNSFNEMYSYFKIKRIIVLKPDFNEITKCNNDILQNACKSTSSNYNTCIMCHSTFNNIDENEQVYIKTLGSIQTNNYIAIYSFEDNNVSSKRKTTYFVWVDLGVSYE